MFQFPYNSTMYYIVGLMNLSCTKMYNTLCMVTVTCISVQESGVFNDIQVYTGTHTLI